MPTLIASENCVSSGSSNGPIIVGRDLLNNRLTTKEGSGYAKGRQVELYRQTETKS
jgi:hypothetical protein